MYSAYFVNHRTGELLQISTTQDKPEGIEWEQINYSEFKLYLRIANNPKNKR